MKKFTLFLLVMYIFIPISVFAYSDYIIASGSSIGIELKSDHPIIVGGYNIGSYNVLANTPLKVGDKIVKINNKYMNSSSDIWSTIKDLKTDNISLTYERNNQEYTTNIKLYLEDNEYKTGLYVKDTIRGVATLTYIDPETKLFGALGHEIIEKSTKSKFDMTTGSIYQSTITGITRSSDGHPGEKNARSDSGKIYGEVSENTKSGIFGTYTATTPNLKKYKVATSDEIKLGPAKILTVISKDTIEEFDINIIKTNTSSKTKNILFEVADETLLDKTGGIVQGMSGSPIIQGDNIIGAVNYVLVDKTNKGYGIFITNMLEEAEN